MKKQKKKKKPELSLVLLKTSLLTAAFLVLLLFVSSLAVVGFAYFQLDSFTKSASISNQELYSLVETGVTEPVIATDSKKNILLLGVDQIENRPNDPLLTDTMMLVSLDTYTLETRLLSLPRDLWNEKYQTKINALYHYGQERYPEHPENFTTEVVMEMTGVPIHHTLVLTLDDVAAVIDALGGIDVTVEESFTDEQFPRSDVNLETATDPAILYETISFEKGVQRMDGETALKYIRSRHSTGSQGTDDARARRQQHIISAMAGTVLSRKTVTNPQKLGALFSTYQTIFGDALPLTQIIAVARQVAEYDFDLAITIHRDGLSLQTENEKGVIMHPPVTETQNQWTYVIVDEAAFKEEVWQKLNLNR
jgi:LCP family protein required for cell wall assembly